MRFDQIDDTITEVAIERPLSFTIKRRGKKRLFLYPPTLGKFLMYQRLVKELGLSSSSLCDDASLIRNVLNLSETNRQELLRMIAYATMKGDSCLFEDKVQERLSELRKLKPKDICKIILAILTQDDTNRIMKETGLEIEKNNFSKVCEIKSKTPNKNSLSFGGKTIWGTLIDPACERYGWTYEYVLWGISFSALQLLLSDHIKTMLLSDEERKNIPSHLLEGTIKAEDKASLKDYILQQNWS